MALTLREIAPEAQIFALGITFENEDGKVGAIVRAIDWAIENDIDILTYSSAAFLEQSREKVYAAVDRACEHNIVTTFIHYPYERNLFPTGFSVDRDRYARDPDLNIFAWDYNIVMIQSQLEYQNAKPEEQRRMMRPFTSISSTSVVTAGFVALMKSVDNTLPPEQYKNILRQASRELDYEGRIISLAPDVYAALKSIPTVRVPN
jgi:hypothetical protein